MARKKKKLRELTDADIAACEPESIWLETRKCPLPAHCVLWVVVLLLISAVVWACLAKVDVVVVAEIYAARERNTVGISSRDIAQRVPGSVYCETLPEVTEYLRGIAQPGDVILTVGAGDIFRAGEALLK